MLGAGRIRPGFRLVFFRELRWIWRRKYLLLLSTLIPLAAFSSLAVTYVHPIPVDIPLAVLDKDGTTLSRKLIRLVDATEEARVVQRITSLAEGKRGIVAGDYYGVLLIPDDFMEDLFAGKHPNITYFFNTLMLTTGNVSATGVSSAIPAVRAAITAALQVETGLTPDQARQATQPIPLDTHALFNPALNYSYFLLAGLMVAVLQLTISIANTYSIGLDLETKRRAHIIGRLGGTLFNALMGKLLPLTLLSLFVVWSCEIILGAAFDLPVRGNLALLLGGSAVFVIACQSLGLMLAAWISPMNTAISLNAVLAAPAFAYLGVSFPRVAMDGFAWYWSAVLPGTWYAQLHTDQTVRGAPAVYSFEPLLFMGLFIVITGTLAAIPLVRLRRSRLARMKQWRANGQQVPL